MKKVLVTTFKFDELSEEVKDKVREKEYEFLSEIGDTTEQVTDFFTYRLQELDYPTENICWSLSNCQGDGMAFYGRLYSETLVKLRDRLMPGSGRSLPVTFFEEYVTMTIKSSNSHYDHYNTMEIDLDLYRDISPKKQEALNAFMLRIKVDIKETSRTLEREGYNLLEAMREPEYLDECIKSQESMYFDNGEVLTHTFETCMECIA